MKKNGILELIRDGWRPLMAITLVVVIFLYLVVGFFLTVFNVGVVPELPDGAWALASVFAGSYTISRGAEKFSTNWNRRGNKKVEDDLEDLG